MLRRPRPSRREFLEMVGGAIGVAATPGAGPALPASLTSTATPADSRGRWNQGDLVHLIPLVNHRRVLIKTSFSKPLKHTPQLCVGSRLVKGKMSDTLGRFWQFDADGLEAAQEYELQIVDASAGALCDSWPLKTYPTPDANVEHLRILAYTASGGNGEAKLPDGTPFFLPLAVRRRLHGRALSFKPDVAISIGDQVYWDQVTALRHPNKRFREQVKKLYDEYGYIDRDLPVLGSANEKIFTRIVDAQIAHLYGVRFRSVPLYLTQDDHDYFENDAATDEFVSFPPDPYMLRLGRATQHLYYPEFLPESTRPLGLAGSAATDRGHGLSESYGTLRYGKLVEALMYDCRRYMTLKGPTATFITADAEKWLKGRTAAEDTYHLMHIPSTPFGWSAGKWAEWYPDVLQNDGTVATARTKPYWQPGWFSQHQRILKMVHEQKERLALIISGDLHAIGCGTIHRSGDLDLTDNPVHSILAGPLGTAGPGWPSSYRGTGAQLPSQLTVAEGFKPIEKNGFTLIDVAPEKVVFRMFAWRPPEPVEWIDSLEPIHTFELERRG